MKCCILFKGASVGHLIACCMVAGGCDGKRKPTLCEWKGGRCNCIDGAVVQPQFACLEQAQVQAKLYYPSMVHISVAQILAQRHPCGSEVTLLLKEY